MAQLLPQRAYEGGQGPQLSKFLSCFDLADCPALGISLELLEQCPWIVQSQLVDADLPAFPGMDSEKASVRIEVRGLSRHLSGQVLSNTLRYIDSGIRAVGTPDAD